MAAIASIRIVERSVGLIDLAIPRNRDITRYRLSGSKTLNGAFTGTTEMFTVRAQTAFRSPLAIKQKKGGTLSMHRKESTRMLFNLNDYSVPATPDLPSDEEVLYLRVEEFSTAAGLYLPHGPIFVILPPSALGIGRPPITLYGSVPGISAVLGSPAPGGALKIVLPGISTQISILNHHATDALAASFDASGAMISIPASQSPGLLIGGRVKELFLGSTTGNAIDFSLFAAFKAD